MQKPRKQNRQSWLVLQTRRQCPPFYSKITSKIASFFFLSGFFTHKNENKLGFIVKEKKRDSPTCTIIIYIQLIKRGDSIFLLILKKGMTVKLVEYHEVASVERHHHIRGCEAAHIITSS